jgi:hypothetical protein
MVHEQVRKHESQCCIDPRIMLETIRHREAEGLRSPLPARLEAWRIRQ